MDSDRLPVGRRVAYWRGRRRMSQQVFADRLGKSKNWVDKVERVELVARPLPPARNRLPIAVSPAGRPGRG
ncbi:helix-turn-helix domain-containing protein [Micromonospora sp. NBC_01655]|uniref:helix-turn-helix domain-containing protein n=1 Tax=Micromonospora sp. NBC_01655 TaxID=2975983 RepID=UPI002257B398|nr:helix-turn-helix domain-containing protein [Micromonospora sp. NBC_01655]MCX4472181.1 helix-turn-helix domain-containing protein [Micromonospora sp. NBC_01655]